jgi:hypothetical protein
MDMDVLESKPVPAPRAEAVHLQGMHDLRVMAWQVAATVTGVFATLTLILAIIAHMRGWI